MHFFFLYVSFLLRNYDNLRVCNQFSAIPQPRAHITIHTTINIEQSGMRDFKYNDHPTMTSYMAKWKSALHWYGSYGFELAPDYQSKIRKFSRAYLDLRINVTPKVHAVMHHISEFCEKTGRGLGPWSEQASESIHHDFKQTWQRFKINKTDHELYGKKSLASSINI